MINTFINIVSINTVGLERLQDRLLEKQNQEMLLYII